MIRLNELGRRFDSVMRARNGKGNVSMEALVGTVTREVDAMYEAMERFKDFRFGWEWLPFGDPGYTMTYGEALEWTGMDVEIEAAEVGGVLLHL
jgi:hypothetical protein